MEGFKKGMNMYQRNNASRFLYSSFKRLKNKFLT
ncbi:hypothetical protein ZPR_3251 [Zunongwangia profunda SM-A87]|uniref:Uncharacterized protein n=1 Tax=Zunongwangia profunda (strain DSM 18752 / CCTCC AB 206139 / SM-A87) TaxID=655815 RepID=D5BIF4_ZUNPS|nr:hypothetical protein ZPR_3251 [Zunongwangia profunda SM-A87]